MNESKTAKALSLLQQSVKNAAQLEHPWLHWFLYGGSGCLDEDTYLAYQIRTADGKGQADKGGTIKRLFHRFHGIPYAGKGSYQRPETEDSAFYLPSVDDEGRVFHNRVVGVVKSGVKPCFRVETEDGVIVATADHKFMVDEGFKPCGDLAVGEFVFVRNSHFGIALVEILSISPVGERETYDVQMAAPHHNFVAAGFVVHNSGKTTAAASFPRPLFLVPANENSIVTLTGMDIPYIEITGQHGPISKGRGGMEAALALIESEYKRSPDDFPYDTIVVESLTHYQDLVQEEITENNAQQMDQRKWGLMATHFRNIQMRLRNLELHVVFTALDHVRENDAGMLVGGPMLAGQTAGKLPSACDIVGYLEAPPSKKGKYTAHFRRRNHYFARSRFRGMPALIEDFKYSEVEQYLIGDKKLKG